MDTLALVALGSNLGDRKAHLDGAVAALRATPGIRVLRVSSYHETPPAGGPPEQGPFLNAAARLESALDAFRLLHRLQEIEREAGRVRVERWGERTLDLDLLMFDSRVIRTPELTLPHPRMPFRRFVVAPLAEIAADLVDTTCGLSVAGMLTNLDRRPSCVALHAPPGRLREFVFDALVAELGAVPIRCAEEVERFLEQVAATHRPPGELRRFPKAAEIRRKWRRARKHRWVVSDCWPTSQPAPWRPSEPIEPFLPEPTFAAALGWAGEEIPLPLMRFARTPLLRVESDDPEEAAAEVLAACRASRGE
jgi:2-amino-4-hydroxy-6-hydroxymethyldihydropteridine diphosphokinase